MEFPYDSCYAYTRLQFLHQPTAAPNLGGILCLFFITACAGRTPHSGVIGTLVLDVVHGTAVQGAHTVLWPWPGMYNLLCGVCYALIMFTLCSLH
jgi:hypothetical protein